MRDLTFTVRPGATAQILRGRSHCTTIRAEARTIDAIWAKDNGVTVVEELLGNSSVQHTPSHG